MIDNFSNSQQIRKQVVATDAGVVASQHRRAADVGASILAAGGAAVDAAVATSFAPGVVQPWMSGIAAGGTMVLWRADEGRARVVNFGMRSPRRLNPADYPLTGDGRTSDLFPWPLVVDDRNVQGATAVAIPGVVDGMGLAHGAYGRKPWQTWWRRPWHWRARACWWTGTPPWSRLPPRNPCPWTRTPRPCSWTTVAGL